MQFPVILFVYHSLTFTTAWDQKQVKNGRDQNDSAFRWRGTTKPQAAKDIQAPLLFAVDRFMAVLMSCPRPLRDKKESKRKLDQLMCSRAAWKELEALSNQEGSSDCCPFNYVVWVSTVVTAEACWGHAGGGLCSRSMCVTVCFCGAPGDGASAGL